MAIAADGACSVLAATNGVTSFAFAISPGGTSLTGNACMLAAFGIISPNATPITVSSVTDSVGNVWTLVTEQASGSGWNTADINAGVQRGHTLSVWMTKNATINTTITITANFSATTDVCVGAFTSKFTGVNATQPLDQNASLPKVLKQVTNVHPDLPGISTNTTNFWPLSFLSMFSSNILTSNVSFNGVLRNDTAITQKNGTEFNKTQVNSGPVVSGAYSSVSFTASSNSDNVWHIGLALTSDSQVNLAARPYAALIG